MHLFAENMQHRQLLLSEVASKRYKMSIVLTSYVTSALEHLVSTYYHIKLGESVGISAAISESSTCIGTAGDAETRQQRGACAATSSS